MTPIQSESNPHLNPIQSESNPQSIQSNRQEKSEIEIKTLTYENNTFSVCPRILPLRINYRQLQREFRDDPLTMVMTTV